MSAVAWKSNLETEANARVTDHVWMSPACHGVESHGTVHCATGGSVISLQTVSLSHHSLSLLLLL